MKVEEIPTMKEKKDKKTKKEKKVKKDKKDKKDKKKSKKLKRDAKENGESKDYDDNQTRKKKKRKLDDILEQNEKKVTFPIKYILAPMVGASELPFRLLCRKYGAQASYTPMMNSHLFSTDAKYRQEEFQTIPEDRPLVCHFSSNDPTDFTNAAKLVQGKCDAVDLNLGCPQRTAYLGHFGSYLLDLKDRELICSIVRMASKNISIPVFVKIRLLNTIEETIELCQQLREAGASLITIHGRYRASFERKGAGARDGPAMLDQILKVRKALGDDFPLISNGNVITFDDVESNLNFTRAHGIMSAEGILDSPALYLPQFGVRNENCDKEIQVPILSSLPSQSNDDKNIRSSIDNGPLFKKRRKLTKKLREIEKLESKLQDNASSLMKTEQDKIASKATIENELLEIQNNEEKNSLSSQPETNDTTTKSSLSSTSSSIVQYEEVQLQQLYEMSDDKLSLALEYLSLVRRYPTKLRTVIFHTRRMLKHLLNEYQLMEECINSKSINEVESIIRKMRKYQNNPSSFHYDKEKEKRDKDALDRKRREEGKRKAYEARMIRKAKREGREDLEYYLRQGAKTPDVTELIKLRTLPKEEQMEQWKAGDHSQHCLAFHLGGCKRDRACAFLHADVLKENTFHEMDEVAG
jgi:tRNA-dihydrouridine synthase 1